MFPFIRRSKNQTINGKTQANRKAKRKALNKMGRISRRINRTK
jgi:hypothetical protein